MADEIRFDNRAVVVTGGARGLGRAQSLLLASRGALIVVADNGTTMDGAAQDGRPAESVVNEIKSAGGKAVACTADLSTETGSGDVVMAALNAYGRIDGIIHYASTCPDLKTIDKLATPDLEMAMRVNAFAGLWMARAAWPHMLRQRYGRIVYTPSAGIYGALGNTDYAAAKGAYIGMTRCLALEGMNTGILVNAIAPSARTRMTERFHASDYSDWFFQTMPPEKVAVGGAYLLSEACDITGEILSMGGGRIARITIAESVGEINVGSSIEQVRDAIPRVMSDKNFFYPKDLQERSSKVASILGFQGGFDSQHTFGVKAIDEAPSQAQP